MLRPRVIPCLLIQNGGLVKTVQFSKPKYVGDPLNAVRIFNEKEVDELMVLDIDASRTGAEPNFQVIEHLAAECRMPLAYGGGIKTVGHIERLIGLGVEKVSLGSGAVLDTQLITQAVERVGSQSIVAVLDVKRTGLLKRPEVVIMNATQRTGEDPVSFARRMCDVGVGEIVLNSVDRDGMMAGYDLDLVNKVKNAIDVPLTVLGGAGSFEDLKALTSVHPVIGAAAGSLFVFKGKFRAVLINYPDRSQLDALCTAA